MRFQWRIAGMIAMAAALACLGCGRKPQQPPQAKPAKRTTTTPLPEWAPKNPSPEFLRAAGVLKPLPDELLQGAMGKSPEGAALLQRLYRTMPASYEFFGTLDDHQIERFLSAKEIRIPGKSLTPKQRAALDRWFENWRVAMKGTGREFEDYLLVVYKNGGKEDLSNVDVGFRATGGGHIVHLYFWVKQPGGKVNDFGSAFAQI